jgi:GNAT superfamily N-acetyltransferase
MIIPAAVALSEQVGVRGPLLEELRNGSRYGDEVFVVIVDEEPVALASAHFHVEHKNAWTPYVNWVVAWTRPDSRRRGYARALSGFIRAEARRRGCVRLRSAIGSREGLALHAAIGDLVWGWDPKSGMLLVDTPLDFARVFPRATPISVRRATTRLEPLDPIEIALGPLLPYDV